MADGTQRLRARALLRSAGIVVAVVSAAVAVFLVVFSEASRSAQFGVLLGLWSALILALSVVRGQEPGEPAQDAGSAGAVQPDEGGEPAGTAARAGAGMALAEPTPQEGPTVEELAESMAVELRRSAELERQAAAAERREFQLQLELMLRREVEQVMQRELTSLRQEIAALRGEILDNVGGQLRLERIETTRLIGSDVQALQQEIRRLASVREALESSMDAEDADVVEDEAGARAAAAVEAPAVETADAEPVEAEPVEAAQVGAEPVEAEPVETAQVEAEPVEAAQVEAEQVEGEPDASAPSPEPAQSTESIESIEPAEADESGAHAAASDDEAAQSAQDRPAGSRHAPSKRTFDFADLPTVSRLTPLPADPQPSRYTGRRRAPADAGEAAGDTPRTGGQRRAREGYDDVLARLLGR